MVSVYASSPCMIEHKNQLPPQQKTFSKPLKHLAHGHRDWRSYYRILVASSRKLAWMWKNDIQGLSAFLFSHFNPSWLAVIHCPEEAFLWRVVHRSYCLCSSRRDTMKVYEENCIPKASTLPSIHLLLAAIVTVLSGGAHFGFQISIVNPMGTLLQDFLFTELSK